MKRPEIRTVVELLGALGIVGSLLFVGMEIQQNSAAMRAEATRALGQSWIDFNIAAASREIQEAFVSVEQHDNPADAPDVDKRIVESMTRSILSNWAIQHYEYRMGVLDAELWAATMREMRGEAEWTVLLWAWPRNRHLYTEPFVAVVDEILYSNAEK